MGTIGSVALIITSLTNNVKSMSRHMIIMISLAGLKQNKTKNHIFEEVLKIIEKSK